MSILLLFLGCFLLYGRSKFFPDYLTLVGKVIKKNKQIVFFLGYLFLTSSYLLLWHQLGWATGFIVYLSAISFAYCMLVIVLPLHKRYIYFIAILCAALVIFENMIL
jgi:hypothetical protein